MVILIVISSVLTLLAGLPYLHDVWLGKTKPRVVTWFVWSALTGLAAAASFSDHQVASGVLTLSETIETGAVVVLAMVKTADTTVGRFDLTCLFGAIVGLALWQAFNSPAMGVIASIVVDLIGSLPTIRHMWQKPYEETWLTFLLSCAGGMYALFAAADNRITAVASPIDIFILNGLFVAIILARRSDVPIPESVEGSMIN